MYDKIDLQQHNFSLKLAWKRAQDRSKWRQLVETDVLTRTHHSIMMMTMMILYRCQSRCFSCRLQPIWWWSTIFRTW